MYSSWSANRRMFSVWSTAPMQGTARYASRCSRVFQAKVATRSPGPRPGRPAPTRAGPPARPPRRSASASARRRARSPPRCPRAPSHAPERVLEGERIVVLHQPFEHASPLACTGVVPGSRAGDPSALGAADRHAHGAPAVPEGSQRLVGRLVHHQLALERARTRSISALSSCSTAAAWRSRLRTRRRIRSISPRARTPSRRRRGSSQLARELLDPAQPLHVLLGDRRVFLGERLGVISPRDS